MTPAQRGANAYQAAAGHRGARDQEADIFRRATGALRSGHQRGGRDRVRALADNRRLWLAVADLMVDPANRLPPELRAAVISLGIAVRREMEKAEPDVNFLITINETITAGLAGEP